MPPTAVIPLNDRRPQGATLQMVAPFTYKLTTTIALCERGWGRILKMSPDLKGERL
ncbi:hypothetical protein [Fervidibacter sacchari]